tara:strand:- start:2181 stop:2642 length:462 start_codon:yes stop_codon:yes gene_type:complete
MDCNNKDKIISYIENDLSAEEMSQFRLDLDNNSELMSEYNEMKSILDSLKKMPKIEASNNFMVALNKKIDAYESKSITNFNGILNKIINYDYLPQLSIGMASLVCLFIVNYFWVPGINEGSKNMLSKSSLVSNSLDEQVADIDSLEIDKNLDE